MLVELFEINEPTAYSPPNPHVDAQPTGDESVIVDDFTVMRIDQIEHGVEATSFLEREYCHPFECGIRVAFVPADLISHLPHAYPQRCGFTACHRSQTNTGTAGLDGYQSARSRG